MRKKKWTIADFDRKAAADLSEETGLCLLAASVLCARGINSPEETFRFLSADLDALHDPFLLDGMADAVKEIRGAMERGEKIAVYGDYDVDGITATCVLIQYFQENGADCLYYIPDRIHEGYGLNTEALAALHSEGVKLVITVDSGIAALEEAEQAAALGLRLVITDHHECKQELPRAAAIVNPRKECCRYPFPALAGVGVAFKLVCALEQDTRGLPELIRRYGDLVALGTVADVMPLVDENRALVHFGLEAIANTSHIGLKMLIKHAGLEEKRITSGQVGYVLAPRINAAGRLGCADKAARLFLTEDKKEACQLALFLCEQNRQRQETENLILTEIRERLRKEFCPERDKMIMLWGEGWHNGVIGIVSSRIAEKYAVPSILISLDGDTGKGSGRSVRGFNLYSALEQNAGLLEKYGGHELAVGLSVKREHLETLRQAVFALAAEQAGAFDRAPCLPVDSEVDAQMLTVNMVRGLFKLEPFGAGNPQPVFCMRDVFVRQVTPVCQNKHLRFTVEKDGVLFSAFLFGTDISGCPVSEGEWADIAFAAEINCYRKTASVQLVIKDLRQSETETAWDNEALSVYRRFMDGEALLPEEAESLIPLRQEFVSVFRFIKANAEDGVLEMDSGVLYRRIRRENRGDMSFARFRVCLDVFHEFGIFKVAEQGGELHIAVCNIKGKADICHSQVLARIKGCSCLAAGRKNAPEIPDTPAAAAKTTERVF